jgi:digeranylgeranylglycerophospholipid reductase
LIEKQSQSGKKVCAGGLEYHLVKEFDIDEDVIECFPESIYLCNRTLLTEKKIKCADVYRSKFDPFLTERAIEAGVKFIPSTECLSVIKKGLEIKGVTVKNPIKIYNLFCDVVIAADGFHSATAKSAGLHSNYSRADFGVTLQCEVNTKSRVNTDSVHLFYGRDIANCGYGWIYPKKDSYTVGLGCLSSEMRGGGLVEKLNYLVYKHPIASKILHIPKSISKFEGACVPLKQSEKIFDKNIVVVGDAAGHVAPLSGSGVYHAMKGGQLAAEIVIKAISESNSRTHVNFLKQYQILWDSLFGEELDRQKKILKILDGYFANYMEIQIFLDNNPRIRKVIDTSTLPLKRILLDKIFTH